VLEFMKPLCGSERRAPLAHQDDGCQFPIEKNFPFDS
jgi:hypothetical protein